MSAQSTDLLVELCHVAFPIWLCFQNYQISRHLARVLLNCGWVQVQVMSDLSDAMALFVPVNDDAA
jgi:hypothetical protein